MCGFTWREPKTGTYTLKVIQDSGPFMGTLEAEQKITITNK